MPQNSLHSQTVDSGVAGGNQNSDPPRALCLEHGIARINDAILAAAKGLRPRMREKWRVENIARSEPRSSAAGPLAKLIVDLASAGSARTKLFAIRDQITALIISATPRTHDREVRLTLVRETDVECAANPTQNRVLADPQNSAERARLIEQLLAHRGAIDEALEALIAADVTDAGTRMRFLGDVA